MAAKKEPESERCGTCGACKECGAQPPQIVPMPYPVYPAYPHAPYPNYYPHWQRPSIIYGMSQGAVSSSPNQTNLIVSSPGWQSNAGSNYTH